VTETIHKTELGDLYHGILVRNVCRMVEICDLHCLMYTCRLGIQFDVQTSSPICVDLLVILVSTTYRFRHQLKFMGASIPGLSKNLE